MLSAVSKRGKPIFMLYKDNMDIEDPIDLGNVLSGEQ